MELESEMEVDRTYENAKEAVPILVALEDMNHPHPPTPMQVDNTTKVAFVNNILKQGISKAIDMRSYWIQDRVDQKIFMVYWRLGA